MKQTMIVTGASSGIGAEITRQALAQGWQVVGIARNQEKLDTIAKESADFIALPTDLSDRTSIENCLKTLSNYSISALVNNAGIYRPAPIEESHDEIWEAHFHSNLMSAVRLTQGLWQNLKANKGAIVNISSTLAIRPIANTSAYSALKAAMNTWSLSLALEGAADGVRCNCICPGIVDTPIHGFHGSESKDNRELFEMLQKAQPMGRTGRVQDIAPMVLQFCSADSSWVTGTIVPVDGGILLNS